MARKSKPGKVTPIEKTVVKVDQKGWPAVPFLMRDGSAYIGKPIVVLQRGLREWLGVTWGFEESGVVARTLVDQKCHPTNKLHRFTWQSPEVDGVANDITLTHLSSIRRNALESGATPEAIRLMHAYEPFTEQEIDIMTDKLAKKGAAAKAAPGKNDAKPKSGGRGNPEALAKARAAKADAGPDTRKLTIVNKDGPGYREGSNRATSWAALKGAKTAQDYKDAGGKAKYLTRWVEEGHISLK